MNSSLINSFGNSKKFIYEEKNLKNLFNYVDDIFSRHVNEIDLIHLEDKGEKRAVNYDEVKIVKCSEIVDPRTKKPVPYGSTIKDYTSIPPFHDRFNIKSSLNEKEQKICMAALRFYNSNCTATEDPAIKVALEIFCRLSFMIQAEVKFYREYAKKYFYRYSTERMSFIDDRFKKFIIQDWKYKVNKMNLPVPVFIFYCCVGYITDISEDIDCRMNKTDYGLFSLSGLIPKSNFCDEWKNKRCLLRDPAWVHKNMTKFDPNPIINQVKELDSLINFHNLKIDVMVSVDALKTILSNRQKNKSFLLPLITKVVNKTKMAVIDTPLPPTSLHGYDNNKYAHNCAIKAIFTTIRCENALDVRTKKVSSMNTERTSKISKYHRRYRLFKLPEEHTEAKDPKNPMNYSYNRWAFSKRNENLQLLIKSSIDFYEQSDEDAAPKFFNLSTKIEYQSEFGAEEMTEEELVEEWCSIAFQPHQPAFIRRVRIDSETSMILSYRDLDLSQIEKDLRRLCDLTPKQLLDRIYYCLRSLKHLSPDNYIIQKTNKQYEKISILRQYTEECSNLDSPKVCVKKMYDEMFFDYPIVQLVEYMQLDDREISYHNNENDLLPCTFPYWIMSESEAVSDFRGKTTNQASCAKTIFKHQNIKRNKIDAFNTPAVYPKERGKILTQQTETTKKFRSQRQRKKKKKILPQAKHNNMNISTIPKTSASTTAREDLLILNKFPKERRRKKKENILPQAKHNNIFISTVPETSASTTAREDLGILNKFPKERIFTQETETTKKISSQQRKNEKETILPKAKRTNMYAPSVPEASASTTAKEEILNKCPEVKEDILKQETETTKNVISQQQRIEKKKVLPEMKNINKDISTVPEASASTTTIGDRTNTKVRGSDSIFENKYVTEFGKFNNETKKNVRSHTTQSRYLFNMPHEIEDIFHRDRETENTVHDEPKSKKSNKGSDADTDETQSNTGQKEFASGYYVEISNKLQPNLRKIMKADDKDKTNADTQADPIATVADPSTTNTNEVSKKIKRKMSYDNTGDSNIVNKKPTKASDVFESQGPEEITEIPGYFVDFYRRYVPSSEKAGVHNPDSGKIEKPCDEIPNRDVENPNTTPEYNDILNYMKRMDYYHK